MRSHMHVCPGCLARKNLVRPDLRVDTLEGALVCSTCHQGGVLAVVGGFAPDAHAKLFLKLFSQDLLGRVALVGGENHVLCPGCCTIHAYKPGPVGWIQGCSAKPVRPHTFPVLNRVMCGVCDDPSGGVVDRIDLRTGVLVRFYVCNKHTPVRDVASQWVNARQFEAAWACKPGCRPRK